MILNLTPHEVTLLREGLPPLVLPVAGPAPRVTVTAEPCGTVEGVPLVRTTSGTIIGLPPVTPGALLVVSRVVCEAARDRPDLVFPDDVVRDAAGVIQGARRLGTLCERMTDTLDPERIRSLLGARSYIPRGRA